MTDSIWITGMGLTTAYGVGNQAFREGYNQGVSAIKPLTVFQNPIYKRTMAAEVSDVEPVDLLGRRGLRNYDRATKLLLAAAEILHQNLGFADTEVRRQHFEDDEVSIAVGTMGSIKSIFDFDLDTIKQPEYVQPGLFPNTVFCASASYAAIRHNIKEACVTVNNDEPSSLYAFDCGMGHLLTGRAKQAVVGSTEELSEIYALALQKIHESRGRRAPILGEGAGLFSLELAATARARGASPLAEILAISTCFCPDKQAGYAHNLERLVAQVGGDAIRDIDVIMSAQKIDLDEDLPLDHVPEKRHIYPKLGFLNGLTGTLELAAALVDRTIPKDALILINNASEDGNHASLLLRKCAA